MLNKKKLEDLIVDVDYIANKENNNCQDTIREGGGSPQVRAVVSLVSPSCPWLVRAPKMLQLCINHLVLVLCRSV
jgi:hypothetical protein